MVGAVRVRWGVDEGHIPRGGPLNPFSHFQPRFFCSPILPRSALLPLGFLTIVALMLRVVWESCNYI